MSLVPKLTPDQVPLINQQIEKLQSAMLALWAMDPKPLSPEGDLGPDFNEHLMEQLAEIRGRAHTVAGEAFSLMEGLRRCWNLNYPPLAAPVVRQPAARTTLDDLAV